MLYWVQTVTHTHIHTHTQYTRGVNTCSSLASFAALFTAPPKPAPNAGAASLATGSEGSDIRSTPVGAQAEGVGDDEKTPQVPMQVAPTMEASEPHVQVNAPAKGTRDTRPTVSGVSTDPEGSDGLVTPSRAPSQTASPDEATSPFAGLAKLAPNTVAANPCTPMGAAPEQAAQDMDTSTQQPCDARGAVIIGQKRRVDDAEVPGLCASPLRLHIHVQSPEPLTYKLSLLPCEPEEAPRAVFCHAYTGELPDNPDMLIAVGILYGA